MQHSEKKNLHNLTNNGELLGWAVKYCLYFINIPYNFKTSFEKNDSAFLYSLSCINMREIKFITKYVITNIKKFICSQRPMLNRQRGLK